MLTYLPITVFFPFTLPLKTRFPQKELTTKHFYLSPKWETIFNSKRWKSIKARRLVTVTCFSLGHECLSTFSKRYILWLENQFDDTSQKDMIHNSEIPFLSSVQKPWGGDIFFPNTNHLNYFNDT